MDDHSAQRSHFEVIVSEESKKSAKNMQYGIITSSAHHYHHHCWALCFALSRQLYVPLINLLILLQWHCCTRFSGNARSSCALHKNSLGGKLSPRIRRPPGPFNHCSAFRSEKGPTGGLQQEDCRRMIASLFIFSTHLTASRDFDLCRSEGPWMYKDT